MKTVPASEHRVECKGVDTSMSKRGRVKNRAWVIKPGVSPLFIVVLGLGLCYDWCILIGWFHHPYPQFSSAVNLIWMRTRVLRLNNGSLSGFWLMYCCLLLKIFMAGIVNVRCPTTLMIWWFSVRAAVTGKLDIISTWFVFYSFFFLFIVSVSVWFSRILYVCFCGHFASSSCEENKYFKSALTIGASFFLE